jgi:hypothetical protein
MPRTNEQLRKIVNMLADERQAPVALNMLRAEAEERRVVVSDLLAALAPAAAPGAEARVLEETDSLELAIGQRIDHRSYGLRSEIKHETDKAYLVRSPVGGPDVWLPKSQIDYRGEDAVGRAILILPTWLARKHGFV